MLLPDYFTLILTWSLGNVAAAPFAEAESSSDPRPAPTTRQATSNDTDLSKLPDILPTSFKQQLSATLNDISADALDRWVTASPISITSLGSADVTESNKDLSGLVDHAFTDDPTNPSTDGWVDTYLKFLEEVGNTNITQTQEAVLFNNFSNALENFASVQVILVNAYEAAHANYSYIGLNVWNASRIDPLSLATIEDWGAHATTGTTYSPNEWGSYVQFNQTFTEVRQQYLALTEEVQYAFQGNLYKTSVHTPPTLFNLSMVVGGDAQSGQVAPAWGATIVNNSIISPSTVKELPANLTTSAAPSTTSLSPAVSAAAQNSTVSFSDPTGNLMFLEVTPGKWAENLTSSVAFALKQKPDVAEKYFGKGNSGSGPIGRIWTHICVMTIDDPKSSGLPGSVQVLGKVWDVLPALKQ
ncbi:hypothetical protein GGX14DRAFT_439913 [Mycena pura]|uniref:Uncharacterized protein n=1 Tax=Mycena pura TaxID=153505 RepID=A0AAD6VNK6_9AGAR|nr:hypothetical protein GGX14DRAFT_439913 [Mycena pura]